MSKENCEVGDKILIREGKNSKLIAYTDYGKVIIPINKPKCGYAMISEIVRVTEKYILVKAYNIITDYYDGIQYEEFKEALKAHGYKIGFDRPFETKYEYGTEHQILAYNLDNGAVIVAETFYGSKTFNSIDVYCPNVNALGQRIPMMSQTSSTMTVLNLCYDRNFEFPLQWINNLIKNKYWNTRDNIHLWTYADLDEDNNCSFKTNNKYGFGISSLWTNTIDRILLADNEIENILGNCTKLKPVFKTRK